MKNTTDFYSSLPDRVKDFVDRQYEDAYRLLDASRHPETGLYADSYKTLEDNPEQKCSIAATGVGLIGLCIADTEGWDQEAADKAIVTLNSVMGKTENCLPARDEKTGFFAHFVDMETGDNLHSEISTIDTSLLVAGALFAGQHFKDTVPEIDVMANELLEEIDWSVVVADKDNGSIHMVVKDGKGIMPLPAYNEYVLVAHLALLGQPENETIQELWQQNFSENKIHELPQVLYRDVPVLTDTNGKDGADSFLFFFRTPVSFLPGT